MLLGRSFYYGNSVTVKALPSAGYDFANWTENSSIVSDSLNYTFSERQSKLGCQLHNNANIGVMPEIINANSSRAPSIFVYNSGGGNEVECSLKCIWITIISEASGTNNGEQN